MSVDKLVDSAQLESDLTSVADAIRAKTGGSADLQFPADFVSEIGSISGGGWSIDGILDRSEPSGDITISASSISNRSSLRSCTNITGATVTTAVTFPSNFFNDCYNMTYVFAPYARISGNSYFAQYCEKMEVVVIGSTNGCSYGLAQMLRSGRTSLTKVDIVNTSSLAGQQFYGDNALNTIILRGSGLYALGNVNSFNCRHFKSGGTGGTIYIPKVLYDELGTGSANDYKAATNWSTVDAYGTITWAQIEGSQYEHYYADGTPIPTT